MNLKQEQKVWNINFNSTKVRLKAYAIRPQRIDFRQFQFHKGSIKRESNIMDNLVIERFQFHKGSIKSVKVYYRHAPFVEISIPQRFD